jgi:hypothetical protein
LPDNRLEEIAHVEIEGNLPALWALMQGPGRRTDRHDLHLSLSLSLSLSPVAPTLEYRASVKRFVSLQFLNPKTVGRTPWTGDQPVARPLPIKIQNKHIHISMP